MQNPFECLRTNPATPKAPTQNHQAEQQRQRISFSECLYEFLNKWAAQARNGVIEWDACVNEWVALMERCKGNELMTGILQHVFDLMEMAYNEARRPLRESAIDFPVDP